MSQFIILLAGNPIPHQQALKINQRGGVYTNSKYKKMKEDFSMLLRLEANKQRFKPIKGDYSISCTIYFQNRKHCDLDNAAKGIFDAAQGILFSNDKNAAEIFLYRMYDKKNPHVEIQIEEI